MPRIHDKYVIELKEVIKGYGNDPQVKDPLRVPCDYKFYEIDGVAICEESFKKMKLLEDIAIPKADYENRLKADLKAILVELQLEIEEIEKPLCHSATYAKGCVDKGKIEGLIQQKINNIKETVDATDRC